MKKMRLAKFKSSVENQLRIGPTENWSCEETGLTRTETGLARSENWHVQLIYARKS